MFGNDFKRTHSPKWLKFRGEREWKAQGRQRRGKGNSPPFSLMHFAKNFLPAGCPSYALTCRKQLSVMVSHVHFVLQR